MKNHVKKLTCPKCKSTFEQTHLSSRQKCTVCDASVTSAFDVQFGDHVLVQGFVEKIMGIEHDTEHKIVTFRFLRKSNPFVIRTWNWYSFETMFEIV